MEDFSIDSLVNFNNHHFDECYVYNHRNFIIIQFVTTCIIICIALPSTSVIICALYCLVRNDHVAPIYVINLLISNLVCLCSQIVRMAHPNNWTVFQIGNFVSVLSLVASVCFMVCIALERYLVIACPLWYSSRRNIKNSVLVCVVVWTLALLFVLILDFQADIDYHDSILVFIYETIFGLFYRYIFGVFLLLPLPLFIFFLGGALIALSASRVPSDEKRRIVGLLVLVLFIYSLLFLPLIVYLLGAEEAMCNYVLWGLSLTCLRLTPLADLTLYVFMKKGTIDRLLSCVCCCRMDSSDISSSPV